MDFLHTISTKLAPIAALIVLAALVLFALGNFLKALGKWSRMPAIAGLACQHAGDTCLSMSADLKKFATSLSNFAAVVSQMFGPPPPPVDNGTTRSPETPSGPGPSISQVSIIDAEETQRDMRVFPVAKPIPLVQSAPRVILGLLLIAIAFSQSACAGRFDLGPSHAISQARTSVTASSAQPLSPAQCLQIDDRRISDTAISQGAIGIAGGLSLATLSSIPIDDKTAKISVLIGGVVLSAIAAGIGIGEQSAANGLAQQWQQGGCGQ